MSPAEMARLLREAQADIEAVDGFNVAIAKIGRVADSLEAAWPAESVGAVTWEAVDSGEHSAR